ncbi:hypothetical protein [Bradyrhizobium sp. I1.7.5]|uniref:hypothetical protein n=1 Tax=Bradyrhizobium sp. I1.7.5 TaxID=3156363 RepID=UPI0033972EE6
MMMNSNISRPHDGSSIAPPMRLVPFGKSCSYGGWGKTHGYKLIGEGKIIAYKRGKRTLVDLDSIDAYHASLERIQPKAA